MAPRRSWTKANNPYWSTHVETGIAAIKKRRNIAADASFR